VAEKLDSGDPRQARTGLAGMTTGKDDKGFVSFPPACPVGRLVGNHSL